MTDAEEQQILRLVDELRKRGVTKFQLENLSFDLLPSIEPFKESKEAQTLNCKCGHAPYEHNGPQCLMGCDIEKCAGMNG